MLQDEWYIGFHRGLAARSRRLGASSEPASQGGLQQLSELRQRHVVWDETLTATGKAFRRRVANNMSGLSDRLDEAPTAALLARHLDGDS